MKGRFSTTFVLGVLISCVSAVQVFGDKEKPCPGGELLVRHVYSECNKKTGKWMFVEDQYFACPPKGNVQKFRVDEVPTKEDCGPRGVAAPKVVGGFYRQLQGDVTCQAPMKEKTILLLECITGSWAYASYDIFKCEDGSRRIALPATNIITPQPLVTCDKNPPPPVK